MPLDMRTMLVLYGLANIITTAAVGTVWYQNRRHFAGPGYWLIHFLCQTAMTALFLLRGTLPDFLSIAVANTVAMGGVIALYIGLEKFTGRQSSQVHNYALLAVFFTVHLYFTIVNPDLIARNINVTLMTLYLAVQIAWLLLHRVGAELRRLTRLTGVIVCAHLAVSLARLVLSLAFPTTSADFFQPGAVDGLALLLYGMLCVALGFSLTLMVNRRLLDEVTERARDAEREISKRVQFTRALVHELKTPLTAMIASSELLLEEARGETERSLVENIVRGARSLNDRVSELFDLARGEIGLLRLERRMVNVGELVADIVKEMAPLARSRQQTLELETTDELPVLNLDRERIRQVLVNIIGNAIKFTPAGGKIVVRLGRENGNVLFEIQDNGPGIPDEEQPALFDFYRTRGAGSHASGLRLGLPISRLLVELHGGRIWVNSQVGRGSTFAFTIPINPPPVPEDRSGKGTTVKRH